MVTITRDDLYQIDHAKVSRNGALDLLEVRDLTGDLGLNFVRPTPTVLFKTRPITGFNARRVQPSMFRLRMECLACVERIDTWVFEQLPEVN